MHPGRARHRGMHADPDDRPAQTEQPWAPSHLETHRDGPYFGIDAEAGVEYGDGTPNWMIEALQRAPRDSWRPERDSWNAARRSWDTGAEDSAEDSAEDDA